MIALNTKSEVLKPGENISFDIWLRSDDLPGKKAVNFVFYCESSGEQNDSKIR